MRTVERPVPRAAVAAAVAGAVVLLWWATMPLWPDALLSLLGVADFQCPDARGWGCALGAAVVGVVLGLSLGLALAVGLAWSGLWLARLRPAWPVALLGPVLALPVAWLADPLLHDAWSVLAPAVLGYALAALVTTRRKSTEVTGRRAPRPSAARPAPARTRRRRPRP